MRIKPVQNSIWRGSSSGGCQPPCAHNDLTRVMKRSSCCSSFKSNRAQVVRPVVEVPRIMVPSGLQQKCSAQAWVRGLKSATSCPVVGSRPLVKLYRRSLHRRQANARLSGTSEPIRDFGTRWSIVKRAALSHSGEWQYSHRCCARRRTSWRVNSETDTSAWPTLR